MIVPRRFVRSMLGQMILLSAIFIGAGLWLVAGRPGAGGAAGRPDDPLAATVAQLDAAMWAALAKGQDAAALSARIDSDAAVQQAQARNPGLRYFAMRGDVRVGTAAPRYLAISGVEGLIAARRAMPVGGACTHWQRTVRGAAGIDRIGYVDCGEARYFELRGVARPLDAPATTGIGGDVSRWLTRAGGFLVPALGVLAICVVVILIQRIRIKQITRTVGAVHADGGQHGLPEDGMPTELLPLIRAINAFTAGDAAGERRRRFFLSAAAHEMRTPLTVLRTRLEMLDDSDDRTRLIADVRRLSTLVNDLLTLTGIGERPPALRSVRLYAVCRRAVEALDPVALARHVTIRIEGAIEAAVLGDESLIETAVANLLVNAVAVTPAGGTVWLSVSGTGELSVRDEGPGIAADQVAEIFEPFVRLSDRYPGHGLGLAIVRAVADAHHATVAVDTADGGGARFTIRFSPAPEAAS